MGRKVRRRKRNRNRKRKRKRYGGAKTRTGVPGSEISPQMKPLERESDFGCEKRTTSPSEFLGKEKEEHKKRKEKGGGEGGTV